MARRQRRIERVAFAPEELDAVVVLMERLAGAGDGWINLIPKFADDDERPTSLGFVTLFSGGGSGATMCTWVPASHDHGEPNSVRLGITHVTGHRVVAGLKSLGVLVPENWFVEQDHPRRGLVLRIPYDEPHPQVLDWALRAVAALSNPPPISGWRADVYLPSES